MPVVGETLVQVKPDLSSFDADLKRGLDSAFADLSSDVDKAADDIEKSFKDAADDAAKKLKTIGDGDPFSDVTRDAAKAETEITDHFKDAARKSEDAVKGISFGKIGGGALLAGAITQIPELFSSAITAAEGANAALANTEAIIKSTGSAAGLTSKDIADMASQMSFKIAVDDDDIIAASNVLLTFKNVGSEVFGETMEQAANLGAVLGTDLNSASVMLGKALNDPVKGLTALGKAGVTFTADQKEQIKTMVASGDVLGAQKIILKELESQVGGTAEASATATDKMKVGFGEAKEALGTGLMGAFSALAPVMSKFAEILAPLMEQLGGALGQALAGLVPSFGELLTAVTPLVDVFIALLPVITPIVAILAAGLADLITVLANALLAIVNAIPVPVLQGITIALAALWLVGFGPVTVVIVAIAGLSAALIALVKWIVDNWSTVSEKIGSVLTAVGNFFSELPGKIAGFLKAIVDFLVTWIVNYVQFWAELPGKVWDVFKELGPKVLDVVVDMAGNVIDAIVEWVPKIIQFFLDLPGKAVDALAPIVTKIAFKVTEMTSDVISKLGAWVSDAVQFFLDLPGKAAEGIGSLAVKIGEKVGAMAIDVVTKLGTWVTDTVQFFLDLPGKAAEGLASLGSKVLEKFTGMFGDVKEKIRGWISDIGEIAAGIPGAIVRGIGDVAGAVKDAMIGALKKGVNQAIDAANAIIPDKVGGWSILGVTAPSFSIPQIPRWNFMGGIFDRPTLRPEGFGEAGREVLIPMTRPDRAMQLSDDSGLTAMILDRLGRVGTPDQSTGAPDPDEWGRIAARAFASEMRDMTRAA